MIPHSFDYKRATSVDEAIDLLQSSGYAKILGGGHSLIPAMKLRLNAPETVVDITKIATLKGISIEAGDLVIGAACTHHEIASSEDVKNTLSFLAEGAASIGDVQVRNKGTIGGSIAHADPSADWPALLLAADAKVVIQGPNGLKAVSATDFFTGFFSTVLDEADIIIQIRIPVPPAGTKSTYQKFVQPASRFAIVGCAAVKEPSGATRVAFTGVSDYAFRDEAVENASSQGANPTDASSLAAEDFSIMSDHYASEDYRRHLAKVYARRALLAIS